MDCRPNQIILEYVEFSQSSGKEIGKTKVDGFWLIVFHVIDRINERKSELVSLQFQKA